jgi:hypothetical protein
MGAYTDPAQFCPSGARCPTLNVPPGMLSIDNVSYFQGSWLNAIRTMGRNVTQALQAEASTTNNTLTSYLAGWRAMREGQKKADAAANYLNEVVAPLSTPMLGCSSAAFAQAFSQGILGAHANAQQITRAVLDYNTAMTSSRAVVDRLAQATSPETSAASVIPPAATASAAYPSASDAANFIATVTNPTPALKLTKGQSQTAAGRAYAAAVKAQVARLGLAQQSMARIAGDYQPTMPASIFLATMAAQTGTTSGATEMFQGWLTLAGVVAKAWGVQGPAISLNKALNAAVQAQYDNPLWQTMIQLALEPRVVALVASNTALDNKIELSNLRSIESLTAMAAAQYGTTDTRFDHALATASRVSTTLSK